MGWAGRPEASSNFVVACFGHDFDAVGVDAEQLLHRILDASDKRFLWVKRRLTDDEMFLGYVNYSAVPN